MNGAARLTYSTIAHWAALTWQRPSAADVEALIALDGILLHHEIGDE